MVVLVHIGTCIFRHRFRLLEKTVCIHNKQKVRDEGFCLHTPIQRDLSQQTYRRLFHAGLGWMWNTYPKFHKHCHNYVRNFFVQVSPIAVQKSLLTHCRSSKGTVMGLGTSDKNLWHSPFSMLTDCSRRFLATLGWVKPPMVSPVCCVVKLASPVTVVTKWSGIVTNISWMVQ